MQVSAVIKKETVRIAIWEGAMCAVMVGIFALLGKFDYTVFLGSILGGSFAVFNFFLLAMTVQKATGEENEASAKMKIRASYTGRMFMTFAFGAAAILLPYFNWITSLLPLVFPRIIIALLYLLKIEPREENK